MGEEGLGGRDGRKRREGETRRRGRYYLRTVDGDLKLVSSSVPWYASHCSRLDSKHVVHRDRLLLISSCKWVRREKKGEEEENK